MGGGGRRNVGSCSIQSHSFYHYVPLQWGVCVCVIILKCQIKSFSTQSIAKAPKLSEPMWSGWLLFSDLFSHWIRLLRTHQAGSQPRAFVWLSPLPPDFHLACFFTPSSFCLLKCHLIREAFPDHTASPVEKKSPHSLPVFFSSWHLLYINFVYLSTCNESARKVETVFLVTQVVFNIELAINRASLVAQMVENLPANSGDPGLIPGLGRSPGEGNGIPLAWEIPQTEKSGRLQSMGSKKVRHDWLKHTHT